MATNGHAEPVSTQEGISEAEAALYDRQIRLWGVEAQNRMRKAAVLLVCLRGIATEITKNIVLAGIGSLSILDDQAVTEEDLATGFFLRESDIGANRAQAAQERIQLLNPRVQISILHDMSLLSDEHFYSRFDLICLTDSSVELIERVNALTHKMGKQFYATGSFGMNGYAFCDLGKHSYVIEQQERRPDGTLSEDAKKLTVQRSVDFVDFATAQAYVWNLSPKKRRKLNPALSALFVLWEYQRQHHGLMPANESVASALSAIGTTTLPAKGLEIASDLDAFYRDIARTASYDFMPSCAVLGGIVGQDILNALGGREAPLHRIDA
ncbi:hypothetical protein E5Q_06193 [Mixia osmundae IAM 14324]|uniref:Ubiquitin-like 1-activating enzyme E1A n=1 Tax=Mixia osmundae (strain CBS 9802 / IAM 14324 / JCM 22182 / KY 12970) TaxID=764103 RepID=G7E8M5_MIXOS|nr:hypothetical protein E5Q_06193 [Mixia osmundae IAM 14324]